MKKNTKNEKKIITFMGRKFKFVRIENGSAIVINEDGFVTRIRADLIINQIK